MGHYGHKCFVLESLKNFNAGIAIPHNCIHIIGLIIDFYRSNLLVALTSDFLPISQQPRCFLLVKMFFFQVNRLPSYITKYLVSLTWVNSQLFIVIVGQVALLSVNVICTNFSTSTLNFHSINQYSMLFSLVCKLFEAEIELIAFVYVTIPFLL